MFFAQAYFGLSLHIMNIVENFNTLKNSIPENVRIVAISKYKPATDIQTLYDGAQHVFFGENKAQEMTQKHEILPKDIEWNFVGHLQTNKVKMIAPYVSLIQSIDSLKLLKEVNKEAAKCERVIPCLLQLYIAKEETKFGFDEDEILAMVDSTDFNTLQNIQVHGLMGMATNTDNTLQVAAEFKTLRNFYESLKTRYFSQNSEFSIVSMGMTEDYPIAIAEGSNLIRVGSGIFGSRY